MEGNTVESGDVRGLLNKFNRQADAVDASTRRDSGPAKTPSPALRTWVQPGTAPAATAENNRLKHKPMPMATPQPLGAGNFQPRELVRMPWPESRRPSPSPLRLPPVGAGFPPVGAGFPRPPTPTSFSPRMLDTGRVRLAEELLQNMKLNRAPGTTAPAQTPTPTPVKALMPAQQPAGWGDSEDLTPLRRPLPPEARQPLKPGRPQQVNLEPYLKSPRPPALPLLKKNNGSPTIGGRNLPSPGIFLPPGLPREAIPQKPPMSKQNTQEMYDDVDNLDTTNPWDNNGESDNSDVYESIEDESQAPPGPKTPEKQNNLPELSKKEKKEQQKQENELRKKFKLKGPLEVIHTAKVRWDWQGGKLDLAVRQGDNLDILRVKDNPGGKWLARSLGGKCGYVSMDCVDVDYEGVRHQLQQSANQLYASTLPPPPPDPPQLREHSFDVDSLSHTDSVANDNDDYDDVQLPEDFPPPPEFSTDPRVAQELKSKFKFEGPVRVLHTAMVNPNGVIIRPKGKELAVAQGEILDVLQLTNQKMALCQNHIGKFGYVSRALLLPMEGDVYDDIDQFNDVYDNDTLH